MNTRMKKSAYLLIGLYAWIVSIFFGAILMDIVYSRAASIDLDPFDTATLFSQGADFLLLLSTLTLLAGVAAIIFTWSYPSPRNLLIASLFFVAAELFIPPSFGSFLFRLQTAWGIHIGTWVRLVESVFSSILAFISLWRFQPTTS
jgi:hypothetical protein